MNRRPAASAPTGAAPRAAAAHASLLETLSQELESARRLGEAVDLQRAALRDSDPERLRRAADLVRLRAGFLAELERARERSLLALGLRPGATLEESAAAAATAGLDPSPILATGAALRQVIAPITRSMAIAQSASEHLAAHLAGLRHRTVPSPTTTYGRAGRIASSGASLSVDLRR